MAGIILSLIIFSKLKRNNLFNLIKIYQLASLGQQTSGLLHDLANPLTGLNLSLYQLTRESSQIYLNQALTCSNKIQQIIEANRVQFQNINIENNFNLKTTIEQALEILHYPLIKQNIEVEINVNPQAELFGNQNTFRQIIINILNNTIEAYKILKKEKKIIEINLTIKPDSYYLIIRDQAGGITKSHLDSIFDPLFQTKSGSSTGLYLTKQLLQTDFQAKINLINCPAQGVQYCLSIPFDSTSYL